MGKHTEKYLMRKQAEKYFLEKLMRKHTEI
jgi:hypothetical protein